MELPKKFTYPFSYTPHPLVREAAERLISHVASDPALDALFSEGKMLGVLLVAGPAPSPTAASASGPGSCTFQPSLRSSLPAELGPSHLQGHGWPWVAGTTPSPTAASASGPGSCTLQPSLRSSLPAELGPSHLQGHGWPWVASTTPGPDAEEVGVLWGFSGLAGGLSTVEGFVPPIFDLTDPEGYFKIREAEISALTPRIAAEIDPSKKAELMAMRKTMSEDLQKWIFEQFVVLNAKGEIRNVYEIFAERGLVPPGGTGDCALPKMLQYAYLNGLRPVAFGEFWYGRSPKSEVRAHGSFYPSCTGKCGPLLAYMLKGLEVEPNPMEAYSSVLIHEPEILFEDDTLIVVDKPSGLLSVPGKIKAESVLAWLQRRANHAGNGERIFSCHRLDMDTSGVLVFAKSVEAQTAIMRQFEDREVSKSYVALLSNAPVKGTEVRLEKRMRGKIELPLMLDYYDRPRQMVDEQDGKKALTEYEVLDELEGGEILVRFVPRTGRTHQLRVHSAHVEGLGRPIKGDRLYGDMSGGRLCLHAESLIFSHPKTGEKMEFRTDPDFI